MIDGLQFSAPHRLWLLVASAVLLAAYVATIVVRRRRSTAFASSSMLGRLTAGGAGPWRHGLSILFVAAIVLATVGAAQPTVPGQQERKQATIVVAIDVSDSMGATDVAPSRIEAAVGAARTFVADLPSTFDVGLVTAGSSPSVLVAPTLDHGRVLDALGTLELGSRNRAGRRHLHVAVRAPASADHGHRPAGGPDRAAVRRGHDHGAARLRGHRRRHPGRGAGVDDRLRYDQRLGDQPRPGRRGAG